MAQDDGEGDSANWRVRLRQWRKRRRTRKEELAEADEGPAGSTGGGVFGDATTGD